MFVARVEGFRGGSSGESDGSQEPRKVRLSCDFSPFIRRPQRFGDLTRRVSGEDVTSQVSADRVRAHYASFRHRVGIHFRTIEQLASLSSFSEAKLCEPGSSPVKARTVTQRTGREGRSVRSLGRQDPGGATGVVASAGWEAW